MRQAMLVAVWMLVAVPCAAQDADAILFRNVQVFDGVSPGRLENASVLVEGNRIAEVSVGEIAAEDALVIDGRGGTLMPGLTDSHWHVMLSDISPMQAMTADDGYLNLVAVQAAERLLMRGFTTVRDPGGPVFGVRRAIDEGLFPGPRIYPSGAMISQTSGHGDFRSPWDLPAIERRAARPEASGAVRIADGVAEVRRAAREVLMQGATQVKLMAGGGVSSMNDPLDVRQFSLEELRAAVDAADAWNTYVLVHAYTPKAMALAVEAGVRSIEHGNLIDEPTAKLIAERGVWLSLQPFLDDADANPYPEGSVNRAKQLQVTAGTDTAYRLARQYGIDVAFGTDVIGNPAGTARQGARLAKLARWYEPWEVLRIATSQNQRLFKLSGPRDPYPGVNGVIEAGALADLIVVDGDPLSDLDLIADPERNFTIIMKDGVIYKNTLETGAP